MVYRRVLPRDLFNEADLLKCYGRLWICLDNLRNGAGGAGFEEEDVSHFEIAQDPGSGAITVANLTFTVRGVAYRLYRPLNARTAWPLYLGAEENNVDEEDLEIRVFEESGILSAALIEFLLRGT